jgi:cell division protein FtsL
MITWTLLLGALATFIILSLTAFSCVLIAYQTRQIIDCQNIIISLLQRQDTSVSSDSSAHRPT